MKLLEGRGVTIPNDEYVEKQVFFDRKAIANNKEFDLYKIVLTRKNNDKIEVQLGAHLIKESMAALLQEKIYLLSIHDFVPYEIIKTLLIDIDPSFNDNDLVIALCEMSLNTINPGEFFYHVYNRIKRGYSVSNLSDMKILCQKTCKKLYNNNDYSLFLEQIECLKDQLEIISMNTFEGIYEWAGTILNYAKKKRKDDVLWMVNTLKDKAKFGDVIREIGTPLYFNEGFEDSYFRPPSSLEKNNVDLDFFVALFQVINLLVLKNVSCPFKKNCKNNPEGNLVNDNCDNSPWKHDKANGRLCPFGKLWHGWKLFGKSVTQNRSDS